jgi:hypothetical protein
LAAATSRAYLLVVDANFLVEAPRCLVVARAHTRIACASERSVETVSTILAVSVGAYRKRADNGRPPCKSFVFVVVVFGSRCPSTGGRWSAGKVSLFGPKGVLTERGLDGFLPSVLDFEVEVSKISL